MLKILATIFLCSLSLFAQNYKVNLVGNEDKENLSFNITFEVDEEKKPVSLQKLDIREVPNLRSVKILTTPGLKGTLADEREFLVYYKTSLTISGLKIRNLYKAGVVRLYGGENEVTITFDKDHYQNITSFLKYHNIPAEILKDIDNLYGTWNEVDYSDIKIEKLDTQTKKSEETAKIVVEIKKEDVKADETIIPITSFKE